MSLASSAAAAGDNGSAREIYDAQKQSTEQHKNRNAHEAQLSWVLSSCWCRSLSCVRYCWFSIDIQKYMHTDMHINLYARALALLRMPQH